MFVFFLGLLFCNRNIIFDSNLRCRKVAKLEMMAKTWSNYHSGHTFSTVFFLGCHTSIQHVDSSWMFIDPFTDDLSEPCILFFPIVP